MVWLFFFFSSRRRHTRSLCDWFRRVLFRSARHTLGCSPWVPVSVLGTVISAAFHGTKASLAFPCRLRDLLTMTVLQSLRTFRHSMTEVRKLALAVTINAERHTNVNAFPFRSSRLRLTLGPANPRLIIIAEEPLPLRWCGFSPHYAATLP